MAAAAFFATVFFAAATFFATAFLAPAPPVPFLPGAGGSSATAGLPATAVRFPAVVFFAFPAVVFFAAVFFATMSRPLHIL